MKYKLQQETKPRLSTYGKYKAVAVHQRTIETEAILEECADHYVLDKATMRAALSRLSDVVSKHLRNGDKVVLSDVGLLKLEIESDKVDTPADFKPSKHIRGLRLHVIPESIDGTQQLYANIKYEKDR